VPDERTRVLGLQGPRRRKATAPEDASHLALQDSAGYKMGQNPLRNATAAALLLHRSVAVVTCLSGVALQLHELFEKEPASARKRSEEYGVIGIAACHHMIS